VAGCADGKLLVADVGTSTVVETLETCGKPVTGVATQLDGRVAARKRAG